MQTLADITRAAPAPDQFGSSRPGDPAFDAWLKRELVRLFDTVRREELPEDMLRLLGK